ncbi:mitochondrial inner-membrane-bound regulator-domain-containing protein [Staphylotrichum tortipilum]|uniref:Mitochondrial inner-membrane-bound regulator-domain-containing protein n=1 Tax=Staphylotrichum tortipilum TaxID=2831512 RepID=A0AAN6MIR6_9PEZI|nr:mitochondrial inner-membrane-bound regulator-domain-containing protein [Staphylotrichum longicolle]
MLSRKFAGSASFVCLRCRLQLARTSRPPLFAALALSASVSADADAEHATDKPGRQTDGHAAVDPDAPIDAEPRAEPTFIYPFVKPPDRGQSYEPPAPQMYKSRGRFVSPDQEGLSIDILGKPGFAVVLRERESLEKPRELPKLKPDDFDASVQVDPATFLLAGEDTEATHEEVLLNIHELKPTESPCLSVEEFDKLKETLLDGFTSPQLAAYIKEDQESRRFSADIENSLAEAPWVLGLQSWAPFTGGAAAGRPDSHPSGYIANPRSRKERLAVQVLRECWDVGNKDDVDRDGSACIALRDVEFSILTVGTQRWLEGMSRPILAQVKEVRFVRESRTVTIVAPRYPTRLILKQIEKVLSTCRTADFPVALVSPKPGVIAPGVLDEIGRVTNTVTRFDPSGEKIVVTWIQMSKRDKARESAAETVLRFLREAYAPNPRLSTTVDVFPRDVSGRYIPILNCTDKLPWYERDKKWARLTAPVSRETTRSPDLFPVFTLPFPMDPPNAPEQLQGSDSPRGWSLELQTDTSAIFGHVGFTPNEQPSPLSQPVALDSSLPRTFVPTLPSLFSINLPSNLHEHGLWHTTTVIRFAPSPNTPPELAASAPTLELLIDADHRKINSLTALRAIKRTFTGDYLFPEGTIDVRLVQHQYFELPGSVIEIHVQPLLEFLAKSDLRPWESKFSTPPGLRGVRLPQRFFSADETSNESSEGNNPAQDDTNPVQLDYNLASVEVRRDVTAEYRQLKLRYTRVRAGTPGGEWSQLSLDAVHVGAQDDMPLDDELLPYEILGRRKYDNRKFLFHTANKPKRKPALEEIARPASKVEFVNAVRRFVKGESDFKWIEGDEKRVESR